MDRSAMESNPQGLEKFIGWIVGGAVTLVGGAVAYVKMSRPSAPLANGQKAFQDAIRADMKVDAAEMKAMIKDAVDHAEREHEGFRLQIGKLITGLALVNKDIEYIKNGKPK